ncbi:hypothetical protein [Pontibacter vulgaris]|uniref:hypothetical protein n=1 Tax=Pontibacter vulgaris TaxID=2905679 RepID=UPI001FA813A6|nr:hypothetical protein [Pontibacter vulgaris]
MRILHRLLVILLTIIGLSGCNENEVSPTLEDNGDISFEIERTNSTKNYSTSAKQATISHAESGWQLMGNGEIQLSRGITFDVELENGDTLQLGLHFYKNETNPGLLILQDQDSLHWNRRWKYTSAKLEADNFYSDFDGARVLVNNTNVIFNDVINDNFRINVEKALVNNHEQNVLTINFAGTAYGWYDPTGEYWEVYKIKNGKFSGVVE